MAAIPSRSCPLWVKSRRSGCSSLYPQKRTLPGGTGMSALRQMQTSRLYSITSSAVVSTD